jgi:hypothetical protein
MSKKEICHILIFGDSLSDRGTADKAYVLGCIPLKFLAGLEGTSPKGRFSNGYIWADDISAMFASDFIIKQFKKRYGETNAELADDVINKDKRILDALKYDYNLDNDLYVAFENQVFIRSYDEGGLSSYNYAWKPSTSISRFFSRIILSTLEQKRKKALDYDQQHNIPLSQKAQTLVIEWSGANDFITMNARPSILEADRAIKERIKNVEILIQNGYRNFIWFNLPDLSLTPLYQNMTGEKGDNERANAHNCVDYFNKELDQASKRLQAMFSHCSFEVFDVNTIFTDAYHHPEKYRLDPTKLKQPFVTSPDFKILPNGTSPAKGYTFWNDVHPTAYVQAILANNFYQQYHSGFDFIEPKPDAHKAELDISEADLCKAFCTRYAEKLTQDRNGFWGSQRKSNIQYQKANLSKILEHALYEKGARSLEVLKELQWIDDSGNINLNIPALNNAKAEVDSLQNKRTIAAA